ncbi:MAG TPA: DUF6452 family protein [Paludibacter sp.]
MKQIIYLLLISFFISAVSCAVDEECRKNKTVQMIVGFHQKTHNLVTNIYTTSILTVDSLTVQGIDSMGVLVDSVLYNNKKNVSLMSLPLNKFAQESKFVVIFNDKTDTISILHTNTDEYLSLECGCLKIHSIDTVLLLTHNYIDSVKIVNHSVNNVNINNAEHLQIYKFK